MWIALQVNSMVQNVSKNKTKQNKTKSNQTNKQTKQNKTKNNQITLRIFLYMYTIQHKTGS